jgi:transposase
MKRITGWQLPHEVLEHYRFRAIELWKEGKKVKDIAHYFGLHRVTVSYWIAKYREEGMKGLKSRIAPGPEFKLTDGEIKALMKHLEKDATYFGFETPLWTTKRVGLLVKKETGKTLHHSNVWRLLKRMGLSNKKPEKRAAEQNPREAKRWLKEEWPEILAHARKWQATLYFQDETGVSLTPVLGKTWAKKGKTAVVKLTGKRGGFCISAAITPRGTMLFRIEKENVTADTFLDFLEKLRRHHPRRKIIVVTDQARPHIAKKVRDHVEANKKSFALYYLPSYSPELNPDEGVWGYMKDKKLKSHTAMSKEELKAKTMSCLLSMQRRPLLIKSFFRIYYVK